MKQALHILRKDVRHLWVYIALMAGAVIATALIYPASWRGEENEISAGRFLGMALQPELVLILVPLAAWLLLTRVLQEEPLVGDRHFWLTRPYRWQQLLLARGLFYVATMPIPVIVMQMVIIHRAGFSAWAALPVLLVNAGTLSLFLLLFAVIAVVTRTFVQALFTLIGLIIYIAVCAGLSSHFEANRFSPGPDGPLFNFFLILVPIGIIVVQFASRRVLWSRFAFGILLLAFGIVVSVPMGSITVPMNYPEQREPEVLLRFDADSSRKLENLRVDPNSKDVVVRLPLQSGGLVLNHRYSATGLSVKLQGKDGTRWNSGWIPQGLALVPGGSVETAEFQIPQSIFQQLKTTEVQAEIELAIRETVMGGVTKTVLKEGWNDLPAIGRCRAYNARFAGAGLQCQTAVWQPYTAEVGVQYFTAACGSSLSHPGEAGYTHAFGESERVLPMSLPGVWANRIGLGNNLYNEDKVKRYICPGSQITIRRILDGQQMRIRAKADGIHLAEYAGHVMSEDEKDDKED